MKISRTSTRPETGLFGSLPDRGRSVLAESGLLDGRGGSDGWRPGGPEQVDRIDQRPLDPGFNVDPLDELAELLEASLDERSDLGAASKFVAAIERRLPPQAQLPERLARPPWGSDDRSIPPGDCRLPALVKAVFDLYFRDDLYGHWMDADPIVLSSGSFDVFGLPESLKACIRFPLERNWYGYSDSLGRGSAREALAALETARFAGASSVDPSEIAVTLGGTAAVSAVVDFLVDHGASTPGRALCAVPNYPPLVATVARRLPVSMVPASVVDGGVDISELIRKVELGVHVVLLQTVVNPWGLRVPEHQIAALIEQVPSDCFVLLDDCHDAFGPAVAATPLRRSPNVVSIRSMSKRWAAPGLKAGWLVGSEAFVHAFYSHASTTYGGPSSLTYLLLEMFGMFELARLTGELDVASLVDRRTDEYGLTTDGLCAALDDYLVSAEEFSAAVVGLRDFAADRLASAGLGVIRPAYSINVHARIGELSSYELYRRLVSEAGVSVYPGLLAFAGGPGLVRVSPCIPMPALEEGLDRICRWVDHAS